MLRISKLFQCQFRCIYSTAPLSRKGFSGGQRTRKLISGKGGQLNESGDRKSEMLQYKIAEDLSKAIKKGNYDQIISSKVFFISIRSFLSNLAQFCGKGYTV
jgi:hypothetical protein